MTEPDDVASYSRVEYWDSRYAAEPEYDWFPSVYESCVAFVMNTIRELASSANGGGLRVLHLGTGNSKLVSDIAQKAAAEHLSVYQVGLDYSETVIRNMQERASDPNIDWVVGDVLNLTGNASCQIPFDLIIDKGTMDALQANKESDTLDEDLHQMLLQTSCVLKQGGVFVQFTWETPYYRLHITKKPEYGWDNELLYAKRLPETDMYYSYRYTKKA